MAGTFTHGEDGIITTGRFVGRHIDEVERYLEGLEAGMREDTPPPAPAAPAPPDPAAELAARGGARVEALEALHAATVARQEADDEEAFAATVNDYEKYRERIKESKKHAPPQLRIQKGFHKNAYMWLKGQEPEHQRRLLGQEPDPPAVEPDEEEAEQAAEEAPVIETPPPVAPPVPPKPRAVPPAAAKPTGAARGTPAAPKPGKLRVDEAIRGKVNRLAAAMGMGVPQYLEALEARGVTQDQLTAMASGASPNAYRRKSVYDE